MHLLWLCESRGAEHAACISCWNNHLTLDLARRLLWCYSESEFITVKSEAWLAILRLERELAKSH